MNTSTDYTIICNYSGDVMVYKGEIPDSPEYCNALDDFYYILEPNELYELIDDMGERKVAEALAQIINLVDIAELGPKWAVKQLTLSNTAVVEEDDDYDYEFHPDCAKCLRNRPHTANQHFAQLKRNDLASR